MSVAVDEQFSVGYAVPRWSPAWAVPEVPVPESEVHDRAIEYLRSVLLAWIARSELDAKVLRNIGIRWVESEPRSGFDPDLCLVTPKPPERDGGLTTLNLWEPGHRPPQLAIEIVSKGHPYKDYVDTPDRCAACGVEELWIYDPQSFGRRSHGGPHLLQIWRRTPSGFERRHAGDGPAYSEYLGAWLFPTATNQPEAARLHIADDRRPQRYWPTRSEQARLAAEQQRRTAEQQRQAAEQARQTAEQERDALAREVAQLRQQLKGRA